MLLFFTSSDSWQACRPGSQPLYEGADGLVLAFRPITAFSSSRRFQMLRMGFFDISREDARSHFAFGRCRRRHAGTAGNASHFRLRYAP